MNASSTNLIPLTTPRPKPPTSAPAGKKTPDKPSPKRAANKGVENPKSSSRPAAGEKDIARSEIPAKASRDNSDANRRANGKKGSKGHKTDKTNKQVDVANASLAAAGFQTQVIGQTKATGSTALFATILQAAGQTGKTVTPDASKTKAAVSGGRGATLGLAPESKVTVQGLASIRTSAEPSKLEKTPSPVVTVPAAPGILRKALASAVPAKTRSGKGATGEKAASPVTATGKKQVIAPDKVVTPGLAAQVSDQSRKAPQPDVPRGSDILKQSSLASMQGAAVAADKTERSASARPARGSASARPAQGSAWARPARGSVAHNRNKVTLQTKSTRQAKAPAPSAQGILHKRFVTLSQGVDRQARFVVKEPTGTPQNIVVGETAPAGTTATEAVARSALEAGSPVKQITEAFRSSAVRNGQEIVVRLNPPELGRVRVTLRLEGGEVRGVLDVENPRTLTQLQREAPNIMGRLTDAGIEMKRMDLSLSENGPRDSMRDPAWFSQQYGENGPGHGGWDAPGQGRTTDEALSGVPGAEGELQPALMAIGDDSINIWI